jgi:GT2 family glycosyltransferase
MVFTIPDFVKLVKEDKDIISGVYKNSVGEYTCGAYDKKTGVSTPLKDPRGIMKVDWAGMGFMLIKKGVLERLKYPWVKPYMTTIDGKTKMVYEDLGFCLRAKNHGFDVWIDSTVKLGHEKRVII